jgi:hypothetical protein
MTKKEILDLKVDLRTNVEHTATKNIVREEVKKIKTLDHKLDIKLDDKLEDLKREDLRRQAVDLVP